MAICIVFVSLPAQCTSTLCHSSAWTSPSLEEGSVSLESVSLGLQQGPLMF
jgi:hypothetical protein